jgi:hypothetical protein
MNLTENNNLQHAHDQGSTTTPPLTDAQLGILITTDLGENGDGSWRRRMVPLVMCYQRANQR